MKNYISRKCKGFRFVNRTDGVSWTDRMENHIGEIGEITQQFDNVHVVINFKNGVWRYPISLIEEHLIPETPEIPQLGEGILMEVSNDGVEWGGAKLIAKLSNGCYLSTYGNTWKHARPIQEVKKYTKEELVKIVGHDFEMI
jgi:hypothetical protein